MRMRISIGLGVVVGLAGVVGGCSGGKMESYTVAEGGGTAEGTTSKVVVARTKERPANVPDVDLGTSKKVTKNGETYWEHAPTKDDTAFITTKKPLDAKWVTLYVNGLGCPLCASNIDKQLENVPDVEWMYVDLGHGVVQMKLADGGRKPSPMLLNDTVLDAGFTLVKIRTQ